MTVGGRIREIRREKNMTQRELGEKCGLADSAIRRYELGKANPKIETQEKIANALGVSIDQINPSIGIGKAIAETPGLLDDLMESIDTVLDVAETSMINGMIEDFQKLNGSGKKEASKRVKELTEIRKYTDPDF